MQDRVDFAQLVRALARLAAEADFQIDYQKLLQDTRKGEEPQPPDLRTPREDRYLRCADVERLTGLSRSTIYRHISGGAFPRPFALTTRCVRWRESEVFAWMDQHTRTCS